MTTNMTTTTSVTGSEKKQTATTSSSTESQLNGPKKVEGVALSGQQTLVELHASRTNEDVRMYT